MQQSSPFRRLIASFVVGGLVTGTSLPAARAQADASPGAKPEAPATTAPAEKPPAGAPTGAQPKTAQPPAAGAPAATAPAEEAPAEAPPAPPSKETQEKARVAFAAAQEAYGQGDYATAYDQFKTAQELIPSPHAEYWMALSLDGQENREADAAAAYETFLSNPSASMVGDEKVATAKARLAELKAKLPATLTVTTDPAGAKVLINGVVQEGTSPLTVKLPAGTHKIEATLDGHDAVAVDLQLEGGAQVEQKLKLVATTPEPAAATAPAPTPAPPPAAEKAERSMVPAYVTLGIAGAAAVTGTIFGIVALNEKSEYDDDPTTERADDVERNSLIADMAFGVAITLGVTGIVLLTTDDDGDDAKDAARADNSLVVAPYVTPNSGGAAARWTF